eukprot:COSAG06_NODE_8244_length_2219_cov_1.708843_4_plen_223_part_01
MVLASPTWIIPATQISHDQLPLPSSAPSSRHGTDGAAGTAGTGGTAGTAVFRARLRPSWLYSYSDGAIDQASRGVGLPLLDPQYEARAELLIDGISAERLRRTSWLGVARNGGLGLGPAAELGLGDARSIYSTMPAVPLWPGPQVHSDRMTWREEEQGQKGAFHKHWQENARGYKTFPFAHEQLKPITIDILPPPPLLLTSSMGGGQGQGQEERGGLPLCGEM